MRYESMRGHPMNMVPINADCRKCGGPVKALADTEGTVHWCQLCGHAAIVSPSTDAAAVVRSIKREIRRSRALGATNARLRQDLQEIYADASAARGDAAASPLLTMALGPLLRQLLNDHRLTQGALAELIGINRVGIARVVIGHRNATADMCERIAKAMKLTTIERYALELAAARAKGYKI